MKLYRSKIIFLSKVKGYIDNYFDPSNSNYVNKATIQEILCFINIDVIDYYWAL